MCPNIRCDRNFRSSCRNQTARNFGSISESYFFFLLLLQVELPFSFYRILVLQPKNCRGFLKYSIYMNLLVELQASWKLLNPTSFFQAEGRELAVVLPGFLLNLYDHPSEKTCVFCVHHIPWSSCTRCINMALLVLLVWPISRVKKYFNLNYKSFQESWRVKTS